jgi:hypothetical protein
VLGGQCHALATLSAGEITDTHFTEGWVGPGASLDEYGESRPTGFGFPDRPYVDHLAYLNR